jgi:Flp pilus assembly protein TadB
VSHPPLPPPLGAADTLTVQVQGAGREAERVLVLSRPRNGLVEVREFSVGCTAPRDYTTTADELLDSLEAAARKRRRISEDLYVIRSWLGE